MKRSLFLLASVSLLLVAGSVNAEDYKSSSRSSLNDLFNDLKGQASSVPRDKKIFRPVTAVDENPVVGCVRMWAVLADKTGKEISGPINMSLHKWQPDEYFYLYFESATPIMLSLYQLYPETGHPNAGETRVVLPDSDFPQSFQPLRPGQVVRMPILMKMDRTRVDEMMGVAIQCLNLDRPSPCGNPVLDNAPIHTIAQTPATIATRQRRFAEEIGKIGFAGKEYAIPEGARFSAVSMPTDLAATDDYKIIICQPNHLSFLKLTLPKD